MTRQEFALDLYDRGHIIVGYFSIGQGRRLAGAPSSPLKICLRQKRPRTQRLSGEVSEVDHQVLSAAGPLMAEFLEAKELRPEHFLGRSPEGLGLKLSLEKAQRNRSAIPLSRVRADLPEFSAVSGKKGPVKMFLVMGVTMLPETMSAAFDCLSSQGIKITDCISLIDWQLGVKELLADRDVNLHSVFLLNWLLTTLCSNGRIKRSVLEEVQGYRGRLTHYLESIPVS